MFDSKNACQCLFIQLHVLLLGGGEGSASECNRLRAILYLMTPMP